MQKQIFLICLLSWICSLAYAVAPNENKTNSHYKEQIVADISEKTSNGFEQILEEIKKEKRDESTKHCINRFIGKVCVFNSKVTAEKAGDKILVSMNIQNEASKAVEMTLPFNQEKEVMPESALLNGKDVLIKRGVAGFQIMVPAQFMGELKTTFKLNKVQDIPLLTYGNWVFWKGSVLTTKPNISNEVNAATQGGNEYKMAQRVIYLNQGPLVQTSMAIVLKKDTTLTIKNVVTNKWLGVRSNLNVSMQGEDLILDGPAGTWYIEWLSRGDLNEFKSVPIRVIGAQQEGLNKIVVDTRFYNQKDDLALIVQGNGVQLSDINSDWLPNEWQGLPVYVDEVAFKKEKIAEPLSDSKIKLVHREVSIHPNYNQMTVFETYKSEGDGNVSIKSIEDFELKSAQLIEPNGVKRALWLMNCEQRACIDYPLKSNQALKVVFAAKGLTLWNQNAKLNDAKLDIYAPGAERFLTLSNGELKKRSAGLFENFNLYTTFLLLILAYGFWHLLPKKGALILIAMTGLMFIEHSGWLLITVLLFLNMIVIKEVKEILVKRIAYGFLTIQLVAYTVMLMQRIPFYVKKIIHPYLEPGLLISNLQLAFVPTLMNLIAATLLIGIAYWMGGVWESKEMNDEPKQISLKKVIVLVGLFYVFISVNALEKSVYSRNLIESASSVPLAPMVSIEQSSQMEVKNSVSSRSLKGVDMNNTPELALDNDAKQIKTLGIPSVYMDEAINQSLLPIVMDEYSSAMEEIKSNHIWMISGIWYRLWLLVQMLLPAAMLWVMLKLLNKMTDSALAWDTIKKEYADILDIRLASLYAIYKKRREKNVLDESTRAGDKTSKLEEKSSASSVSKDEK